MTRDAAGAVAWARANPKRQTNGPSWDGACAALVYNAGGFPHWYDSAITAYSVAARLGAADRDPSTARPGDVHYWNNVIIGGQEYGHVAIEVSGGGRSVLMASNAVTDNFGHDSGLVSLAGYKARKPWTNYLGHMPRFGQWASVVTAPAGGSITPIGGGTVAPAWRGFPDMQIHNSKRGEYHFADELGGENIANYKTPDINLSEFVDALEAAFSPEKRVYHLTDRQSDIVKAVVARRLAARWPVLIGAQQDLSGPVAAAVKAALAQAGVPTTAAIADAVDKKLADDFSAIPGAVRSRIIAQ